MGTPEFAVPTLRALHHAAHDIVCVYTQPPRPAGRGKKLQPSPVQKEAEVLGIEVRSPKSLKSAEEQERFAALEADIAVVAAYGLILPQAILDAPKHGCLNVHASILPRWRGAAPIHRAIMAGDPVTGITIMQMEAGLDTGPMLATVRTPIEDKTTGELTEELAELGAQLMVGTLRELKNHRPLAQDDEEATYAPKIDKAEARIDWSRPAEELVRHVHGLSPFPGAWFDLDGERVKVLRAEIADGTGSPGEVLDDQLTIACGNGRRTTPRHAAARGQTGHATGRIPARKCGGCGGPLLRLTRFAFTIEFDGTPFAGLQRQKDAPTVQQADRGRAVPDHGREGPSVQRRAHGCRRSCACHAKPYGYRKADHALSPDGGVQRPSAPRSGRDYRIAKLCRTTGTPAFPVSRRRL